MKKTEPTLPKPATGSRAFPRRQAKQRYMCDRCGAGMIERQCKVICPNCGCQFDCSDLTIHFDELGPARVEQFNTFAGKTESSGG